MEPAVLGCGSNLMNIVSSIKCIPKAGGVGYFADESKVVLPSEFSLLV